MDSKEKEIEIVAILIKMCAENNADFLSLPFETQALLLGAFQEGLKLARDIINR